MTAAFDSITLTKGAYEELLEEMRNDKETIRNAEEKNRELMQVRACTDSASSLSDWLWDISLQGKRVLVVKLKTMTALQVPALIALR